MNSINNPVAYLSSFNLNPTSLQPITKCNLAPSDQLATLVFADRNTSKRTATVTAQGEFSLPPDKIKLTIVIRNSKENIQDAKHSVQRRFDYIYQTLKNYRIKDSDITVSKNYNRNEKLYEVVYEISVILDDFRKSEQIHNQFVEKLDQCVTVNEPKFFHSQIRLENIKRQASILAMRNAKHIGLDMARSVNLALGKPLLINEINSKENEGLFSNQNTSNLINEKKSLTELIEEKTITVSVLINVTFELKINKKHNDD